MSCQVVLLPRGLRRCRRNGARADHARKCARADHRARLRAGVHQLGALITRRALAIAQPLGGDGLSRVVFEHDDQVGGGRKDHHRPPPRQGARSGRKARGSAVTVRCGHGHAKRRSWRPLRIRPPCQRRAPDRPSSATVRSTRPRFELARRSDPRTDADALGERAGHHRLAQPVRRTAGRSRSSSSSPSPRRRRGRSARSSVVNRGSTHVALVVLEGQGVEVIPEASGVPSAARGTHGPCRRRPPAARPSAAAATMGMVEFTPPISAQRCA